MAKPWKLHLPRRGAGAGSSGWHGELVELAALFLAVALADLFANTLVHGPLGPLVLTGLGVSLLLSAVVRRWWAHRSARSSAGSRGAAPAADPSGSGRETTDQRNLWRVRAAVRDTPGSLAALAASLAGHRFNILSVQVHAVPGGAVDEFLMEVPPGTTWREVVAATESGGGREVHADRADMHDLIDIPTRVLTLAAQSTGPGAPLPVALRMLLGGSTVCQVRGTGDEGSDSEQVDWMDGTTMRLREPGGGVLTLRRTAPAFTPAEFARARALRDLELRLRERSAMSYPSSPPHEPPIPS